MKKTLVKIKHAFEYCLTPFYHQKGFFYKGKYYPFFFNMYNATWKFDRKYEIPVFIKAIEDYGKEDILEVGNTMKHYVDVKYDIVDKYEKAEGVINEDICSFNPKKKYGLIISISTLEHIGLYQYGKGDKEEIEKAYCNILSLLNQGGKFLFSYSGNGYNPQLDKFIEEQGLDIISYKTNRGTVCFVEVVK
jgi:hypothetical protein